MTIYSKISTPWNTELPVYKDVVGISNDGSMFVFVESTGKLATSTDGTNWFYLQDTIKGHEPTGIYFGNNSWVVTTTTNTILFSQNLDVWSEANLNFVARKVAYGDGKWIAVGDSGNLALSTNLTTWTPQNSGFGSYHIRSVAYGDGTFVIVGSSARLSTSTDGVSWTARAVGTSSSYDLVGVAYGDGLWVAISQRNQIARSADGGISWVGQTAMASGSTIYGDIIYGNGYWLAIKSTTTYKSSDGITWSAAGIAHARESAQNKLSYANGLYICTTSPGRIRYTNNVTDNVWTDASKSSATSRMIDTPEGLIQYGSTDYVLVYKDGVWRKEANTVPSDQSTIRDMIYSSRLNLLIAASTYTYNGSNLGGRIITAPLQFPLVWTARYSSSTSYFDEIASNDDDTLYVACGANEGLLSSTNGTSWTVRSTPIPTPSTVDFANGVWVMSGRGYDSTVQRYRRMIARSGNGTSWTRVYTDPNTTYSSSYCMEYGQNKWVSIESSSGNISTSTDGNTWTDSGSAPSNTVKLKYFEKDDVWIALSAYGDVYKSDDGVSNWQKLAETNSGQGTGYSIEYIHGKYYASFSTGEVLSTLDINSEAWKETDPIVKQSTPWTLTDSNVALDLSTIYDIQYLNDEFVAVSGYGGIATSPDGQNWTRVQESIFGANAGHYTCYGIYYNGTNRYFAMNSTGEVYYASTLSGTWSRTYVSGVILGTRKYAYNGSIYVGIGFSGRLCTSSSGTSSWTVRTSPFGTTNINDVTWADGLFVKVGGSGKIATSTNGTSWTMRDSPTDLPLYSVKYANGLWVAVGGYQAYSATYGDSVIIVSRDGINWTIVYESRNKIAGRFEQVIPTASGWLAVGPRGALASSVDGFNWTRKTVLNGADLNTVAYGKGTSLIGTYSGRIYSSPTTDGGEESWMPVREAYVKHSYNAIKRSANYTSAIVSAEGKLVRVYNSSNISVTEDGVNWTSHRVVDNASVTALGYGNGMWIAGTSGSISTYPPRLFTSTDLITWTEQTTIPGIENIPNHTGISNIVFGGGRWILTVRYAGTTQDVVCVFTSTNGTTWTPADTTISKIRLDELQLQYEGGVWFVIDERNGRLFTSTNGTTWTSSIGSGSSLLRIAYGKGKWVGIGSGSNGRIFTSTNGTTWTSGVSSNVPSLEDITFGGGRWIIVNRSGTTSRILVSEDGENWEQRTLSDTYINLIAYINDWWLLYNSNYEIRYHKDIGELWVNSYSEYPRPGIDAGIPFGGGYYAGANIIVDGIEYALVVAPKDGGERTGLRWKTSTSGSNTLATSPNDGYKNTSHYNTTTYPAMNFCWHLELNGYYDWYLPSDMELEIAYRYLKPGSGNNNTGTGINAYSNPPQTANYTSTGEPFMTKNPLFQDGGSEAFAGTNYWTSNYVSTSYARVRLFSNGLWGNGSRTSTSIRTRAFRRVRVS